ncbi:MAG: aminotransferase class III-fold pyridoxal phosphate-dependent enzyme [Gemmatimonadota bacterium]
MALSRFFGRGRDNPTPAADDATTESVPDAAPEAEADDASEPEFEEGTPEEAPDTSWLMRADAALATGASTGSKRADKLYGHAEPDLPTHFTTARGARFTDVFGIEYLDCTMALGAVALGYAEPRVTRAVMEAASQGNVCGLSSWREVELAERLCAIIPCAERAQILKTGAEATSAAVRLARTYTGREQIIACGYFGWHDWSSDSPGVPASVRKTVDWIPFDEIGALELAVAAAKSSLAAIVIEPIVDHLPSVEWLQRARELADANGAVLIFDEIKTGFRVAPGGYQEVCGVTPDLATFGKAMANGYPVAAVVGQRALMEAARDTWISSTLASESTALAAALAVLDWHDEANICETLGETGKEMRDAVDRAIAASGVEGAHTEGTDHMWSIKWADRALENRFVSQAMREGVLFKRGAYNFPAIAHLEAELQEIERAASAALVSLMDDENA